MKFSIDKQDQYSIFRLDEDQLNTVNAPDVKSEITVLNAEGVRNLIFDLAPVQYVDSSGLSTLLVARRLCQAVNGSFAVTGVQKPVLKLIRISQLEDILNVIPTNHEAVDFIRMEEIERQLGESEE